VPEASRQHCNSAKELTVCRLSICFYDEQDPGTVVALQHRMSRLNRWIVSLAATVAAVPAGYAASLMLCEQSQFGVLLAVTNTLALIP